MDVAAAQLARTGSRAARAVAVLVALLLAAVTAVVTATATAPPARAATVGWTMYDFNGDGWNESAVYTNAYGNVQHVWQDSDANGHYDLYLLFEEVTGRLLWAWFDTNSNTTFDTVIVYSADGGILGVLSNTGTEFDGLWDRLWVPGGLTYYGQCGFSCSSYISYPDTVWGMSWSDRSSPLSNVIPGSPSFDGNIVMTLAKAFDMAPAMHCYNYPETEYCRDREREGRPR